jgi:hypothetical protein
VRQNNHHNHIPNTNPQNLPYKERIELVNEEGEDVDEDCFHNDLAKPRDFKILKSVDLLMMRELPCFRSQHIGDGYFGTCDDDVKVRIVNISTGEWIDNKTAEPFRDHIDSWGGKYLDAMMRLFEWDDEESVKERNRGYKAAADAEAADRLNLSIAPIIVS